MPWEEKSEMNKCFQDWRASLPAPNWGITKIFTVWSWARLSIIAFPHTIQSASASPKWRIFYFSEVVLPKVCCYLYLFFSYQPKITNGFSIPPACHGIHSSDDLMLCSIPYIHPLGLWKHIFLWSRSFHLNKIWLEEIGSSSCIHTIFMRLMYFVMKPPYH